MNIIHFYLMHIESITYLCIYNLYYMYIKGIHDFGLTFLLLIIPINKFSYKILYFFSHSKRLEFIFIFIIMLVSLKKINIIWLKQHKPRLFFMFVLVVSFYYQSAPLKNLSTNMKHESTK